MPEECSMILHQKTRRLKCGINHPQGSGALLKLGCEVYFYLLLPIDQKTCPYYIFLSQGVHQHPPPPLTKTPARIIQCLEKIIFNTLTPDMTTSTFLKSPALQQFCHDNNAFTLADVHQSLNNTDRVTAIIQRQKLLHFPEGQHYNGVAFEMQINPQIKEYIQAKYQDDSEFMLICALKEQLELLLTLKSFEVDMSYKRLKAAKLNEVVFTTYLPNHGKIITLVRVFTNQESPIGYYRLFKRVFQVIANVTGQSVCFWHIHQEGFQGIICDMDNKQTSGLGKYLYELDPSRTTEEHLRSTIVFCQVHFHRNIVKAVGNHPNQQGVRQRMAGLLTCKCMDDYYKLLDLLQAHETDNADNVFHWAQHKRDPVIAAGLNKHCSLIPSEHWDFIRNSTNTAEQTHNKSYAFGRQQLLLPAVKSAWILDKRDIQQYLGRETFSIFHANRTTNMETHYLRHMQRDFSRKRQHSFSSPTMDDDNIQLPSTSGIIPPSLRNEQSSPSVRQSSIRERSWSRQSSSRGRTPTRSSSSALRRVASANIEVQQAQLDIEKEKVEIERERLKLEQERVKLAREQAEVRQLELQNLERERELYKK
ncbi:uncharacterized protein ACHE_60268A [Aspergillus chevalieri]|nr:uncharacterized protein ACHE_60268A [Aspergillus chevalieri]BCR90382.1 hypothetical protein ACHE_60268A [Aspergillus chevalieri]